MIARTLAQPGLTLALFASIAAASLLPSAAQAAQATATASGTVVTPIAITAAANLAFGSFAAGAGGTITVSTSGARTSSGVVALGASAAAARFDITGSASTTYSISHSGTAVLTNTTGGGGETMALAKFSDLTAGNATSGNVSSGTLDGAGAQSLFVGGTLTVGAAQVPGVYTGTVIATVEYN
ncbi:MAG: DUF4402 domain-containing protein [Pseudomonadota bacterium]